MTALSAETRRLLRLSQGGDDPTPAREHAVRNRLIARLGVGALAGVATGPAVVGSAQAGAAIGSTAAKAASAVATTTLAKTVAILVLAAGLGAGVWKGNDVVERLAELPAAVAAQAKQVAKRAWRGMTGEPRRVEAQSRGRAATDPSISSEDRHQRLIAIARRSNRPVAKEAELLLILRAEQALAAGDGERAARYLDQHEALFPGGELHDDREALRTQIDGAGHTVPTPSIVTPHRRTEPANF
jgi:hypothetical protein